jgi:hypothetical protein
MLVHALKLFIHNHVIIFILYKIDDIYFLLRNVVML